MRIPFPLVLSILLAAPLHAQDLAQAGSPEAETEQLFREGEKAYNSGGYVKAIGFFDQVLARDPEHLNAYLQRGFWSNQGSKRVFDSKWEKGFDTREAAEKHQAWVLEMAAANADASN